MKATLKFYRSSPQKVRLVADLIRGKQVEEAEQILNFTKKRPASAIMKLLHSAVANAENNDGVTDISKLYVRNVMVGDAPRLKRFQPVPFGRAHGILHRLCHVWIELGSKEE
ncbi:MAG TPA: 50S ribosomal protein L22 [Thermoanaerobaculia bacterium]|nr:50S ribosomal protein L22 [Thermoanaerobaculia bacterium]HUM30643.1 50S ribosomal protein L22 [Thermoanaerobaculia bacterium]HXK68949.1 50S ribosomal protein L22 [Thermoanaerobaculia bacterium]